jgi:HSP20 family protein
MFEDFGRAVPTFGSTDVVPRLDMTETDKVIEVTAELPGLEEKDVEVNIADNILMIRGEKKSEKEEKDKNYRFVERSYGSFSRSIELPSGVDAERIQASLAKGVLTVTVPKPAQAAMKKIEVKAPA